MESIKEFFKHINYRLSSPFIFSFIISWIFWNWPVTVAFLIHDKSMLDGYHNYIDLIRGRVNNLTGLIFPFVSALAYTILNPIISSAIQLFYTWVQKISEEKQIGILKGGKISTDKYIELRNDVKKKELLLEEVISTEKSAIIELQQRNSDLLIATKELNETKVKLTDAEYETEDVKMKIGLMQNEVIALQKNRELIDSLAEIFSGPWLCEFSLIEVTSVNRGIEPFYIDKNEYIANSERKFIIKEGFRARDFDVVTFDKHNIESGLRYASVTLIKVNSNLWSGVETVGGKLSYVRYYSQSSLPTHWTTAFVLQELTNQNRSIEILQFVLEQTKAGRKI